MMAASLLPDEEAFDVDPAAAGKVEELFVELELFAFTFIVFRGVMDIPEFVVVDIEEMTEELPLGFAWNRLAADAKELDNEDAFVVIPMGCDEMAGIILF